MEHVEQGGGKVISISTLVSGRNDHAFKPTKTHYDHAAQKVGQDNFNELH